MLKKQTNIYVYAHWKGIEEPKIMGVLSAGFIKGKSVFSFEYDEMWLKSKYIRFIDPDIQFFSGKQYPNDKNNFGVFFDSMPDTWGKRLMKHRAIENAKNRNEFAPKLYDIDYLLGVYDACRMGALRFKMEPNGDFLDCTANYSIPTWMSIRELQNAVNILESGDDNISKHINILIEPGSSLGGARPKANILDENNELWIAKFPSMNDEIDKSKWEFLAYRLAVNAGISMHPCRIERISSRHFTFFTKRFDREKHIRIHFASAMTMTGNNEIYLKDEQASYLEIADFIQNHGVYVDDNLSQLWRRIIFNIAISNTDDHLRNHGFILTEKGWKLSPAYDLNPSVDREGLSLNIDTDSNTLDFDLAKSVGTFFRLDNSQMDNIIEHVLNSVSKWKQIATEIGIQRNEIKMMEHAFRKSVL